ncbi:unnamed protein product [Pleuronectes platessa]|uniref:Uncharacterized protein n=1 Tax=Pleuronectes platessa TaxID=8262 RepID=A0A9N7Z4K8_PLEPL|nr:unnamed protein product [Pleuronectes platessa]
MSSQAYEAADRSSHNSLFLQLLSRFLLPPPPSSLLPPPPSSLLPHALPFSPPALSVLRVRENTLVETSGLSPCAPELPPPVREDLRGNPSDSASSHCHSDGQFPSSSLPHPVSPLSPFH